MYSEGPVLMIKLVMHWLQKIEDGNRQGSMGKLGCRGNVGRPRVTLNCDNAIYVAMVCCLLLVNLPRMEIILLTRNQIK